MHNENSFKKILQVNEKKKYFSFAIFVSFQFFLLLNAKLKKKERERENDVFFLFEKGEQMMNQIQYVKHRLVLIS